MFSDFSSENHGVYEIMLKNKVEPERMQTWCKCVTFWISKPTRMQATHAPPQPLPPLHTHTHKILIAFHGNRGFVYMPQCCITRTLPLLL